MQSSPSEPILLPQIDLNAKLLQLDGFFSQECGAPRRSYTTKVSYEGPDGDLETETWVYVRDGRHLAVWSQHKETGEKEARFVVDESGQRYIPDTMRFSRLTGEV